MPDEARKAAGRPSVLEAQVTNAVFLEAGVWEIDGTKIPNITIYNGRENLQLAVDKDCTPPADLKFGDKVDLWFTIGQASKVAGDRSFGVIKLRVLDVVRAGAAARIKAAA
jgi:hypothetical protein